MVFFIVIFPSKGTHYLLNISVISIFIFIHFINQITSLRWQSILIFSTLIWIGSFSVIQVAVLESVGDVRIKAADYLLKKTTPNDYIYFEGIFSQIQDKPKRYAIKAEAARASGSTGLSNDYFATHLSDNSTRFMKEVTDYDPFLNTKYQGWFNNSFDFDSLKKDAPKYYVTVGQYYRQTELNQADYFFKHITFYDSLRNHSSREITFDYPHLDPRWRFATSYYFRPVVIYKLH
jgi:hypothetical protein